MIDAENRFVIINRKHINELYEISPSDAEDFQAAVDNFYAAYTVATGKFLNQKYLACNQDEPYANAVWQLIQGEK
jgi:hypothetical protein